ncbi:MAG TPA: hypothetical protein VHG28_20200 [Longimicrobiaceae bacterium]|nr:hypothetical protein [Longimicrobiaceae bacterium]
MTGLALALVLASAAIHATWNLLAKRSGGGGVAFVWLFAALSALLYAPAAAWVFLTARPELGVTEVVCLAGSSLLHLAYFLLLQRGYRAGDLSLVYPLARGTGPVLATALAIALLGERPSPVALLGAGLVAAGAFGLTLGSRSPEGGGARTAVVYGLLTGMLVAAYTLWDKWGVGILLVPPLLFDWMSNFGRVLLLTPLAARRREEIGAEWRRHRREVVGVALLSPLSYILMLTALSIAPVSYVAPAREVGILFGTLLGTHFLAEGHALRRVSAACLMVLGVIALAVG